jgi:hypothetical protein
MDTGMVPIPSFVLVVALAIIFIFKLRGGKTTIILPRGLYIFYLFVVGASFGMSIVELTRLGLAHLGVGLLPMTPIGMVLVISSLVMQRNGRTRSVSIVGHYSSTLN